MCEYLSRICTCLSGHVGLGVLLCMTVGVAPVAPAWAQSQAALSEIAGETLSTEKEVRSMEQSWSEEERNMLNRIEQLQQRQQKLQLDVKHLRQRLQHKHAQIKFYQRRMSEAGKLRQGLQQWFDTVAADIRTNVAGGIPFLAQERHQRLEALDKVLLDGGVGADEKLTRLMEVLQIEAEYGYSTEVYKGDIALAGERLQVDLVRLGRVSLFFITPDAEQCGVYDPATPGFVYLPQKYAADIKQAIKSIKGQGTDAFNLLPVGKIAL